MKNVLNKSQTPVFRPIWDFDIKFEPDLTLEPYDIPVIFPVFFFNFGNPFITKINFQTFNVQFLMTCFLLGNIPPFNIV